MPTAKPHCDACQHAERNQLDMMLARGTALSVVADTFRLPVTTIDWHYTRHLRHVPKRMRTDPRELVEDLHYLKTRCESVLQAALADDPPKYNIALTAIREASATVMAIAKLTHAEQSLDPTAYMPFYRELKDKLLKAVEHDPEARGRIIKALSFEGNGKDVDESTGEDS